MCNECGSSEPRTEVLPDPVYDRLLIPWEGAGPPAIKIDGWHVWSENALEAEVVMFIDRYLRHLVRTRDDLVIVETGVGQGYTTRQLVHHLRPEHDLYWCYESDDAWRMALSVKDFWLNNLSACLKDYPMPEPREVAIADLMIVHSSKPWSYSELHLWEATSKPDSTLIFTGTMPETQIPTFHLNNPKGTHVLSWDVQRPAHIWSMLFERSWTGG